LAEFSGREKQLVNDELFQSIVFRHCPPILVKKFKSRILERLPKAHQIAIVSAYIASNIVYREGLGWLHRIPKGQRFRAARTYMEKDCQAEKLIDSVRKSSIKDKKQIEEILRRSAARDLTMLEIEGS